MVQEIVFHLGDSKTGTTSIQSVLASRTFSVKDSSYLYTTKINHLPLADTLRGRGQGNPEVRHQRWNELAIKVMESRDEVAIVSAETFEFVDPQVFSDTLDVYFKKFTGQIRLISYVRPHAERLVSSFAERNKQGGFRGSMAAAHEQFLEAGLLTYAPRFARWRQVFGERFELRPMVRASLSQGDVVKDFLNYAFHGREVTFNETDSANESLTVADIVALRRIHERLGESEHYRNAIRRALGWNLATFLSSLPKPAGAQKPHIYRELAEKVRETYRDDAAQVDAAFFQGSPLVDALKSAVDRAPEEPQSLEIEDYFGEDTLRVIDGFCLLMRRVMEADPAHFRVALRPENARPAVIKGAYSKADQGPKAKMDAAASKK